MKSIELVDLMLSPQWTSKVLNHFISGAQSIKPEGVKVELLFLVLPLLTDPISRGAIKLSKASTFYTSFVNNTNLKGGDLLEFKNSIIKKNRQISEYRQYTNNALIYLGSTTGLTISKICQVEAIVAFADEPSSIRPILKSAFYLGVIFAKEDYKNIFWKLGIVNI